MFSRPSPAMIVALTALSVALGGAGIAATGGTFILGQANTASTRSELRASVGGAATLLLRNTSTAAGSSALGLSVAAGKPPMNVNSATKVTNLNADYLDGLSSAAFVRSNAEAWHYIGDPGEPPFLNGWVNYSDHGQPHASAAFQHAAYRIDRTGIVHVRGLIANGIVGEPTPIFRLPPQYCPWSYRLFPVLANNGTDGLGRLNVKFFDGQGCDVTLSFGGNGFVSLEGVSFQTHSLEQPGTSATALRRPAASP